MYIDIKTNRTNYSLVRSIICVAFVTLYGCGGSNSEVEVKNESVAPPSVSLPIDEAHELTGSWLSNCGERSNAAYYINELVLTSDNLEIIQHKYANADCARIPVESISKTIKPYSYPESNSDTNDKFIVVEVLQEPLWKMTVNVEIYDNLLYLSNNLSITHEGFAFDSSQTGEINYVNYLTKNE